MRKTVLALIVIVGLAAGSVVGSGQLTRSSYAKSIPVRADSRLWLEGGSNVRDWTCKATAMEASIELDEMSRLATTGTLPGVRSAFVKVPVRKLKCGDRHMEAHMYEALKAPSRSVESFIIAQLDWFPLSDTVSRTIQVTGILSIAGVNRPVRMLVRGERLPDGTLRARGALPILMTDYGVTPPRPWGGILRTANKVVIQFEIFVDPTIKPS